MAGVAPFGGWIDAMSVQQGAEPGTTTGRRTEATVVDGGLTDLETAGEVRLLLDTGRRIGNSVVRCLLHCAASEVMYTKKMHSQGTIENLPRRLLSESRLTEDTPFPRSPTKMLRRAAARGRGPGWCPRPRR
jgi:hypothetical protein